MNKESQKYLDDYLSTLPAALRNMRTAVDTFHFCSSEKEANICAQLTLSGKKKATASLEWCFTVGTARYPEIGELDVITNWSKVPVCIVEITDVQVVPFIEVPESFAIAEGEGDLSLKYWRDVHWRFFSQECEMLGKEPSESMPIVLQWFKVVYAK